MRDYKWSRVTSRTTINTGDSRSTTRRRHVSTACTSSRCPPRPTRPAIPNMLRLLRPTKYYDSTHTHTHNMHPIFSHASTTLLLYRPIYYPASHFVISVGVYPSTMIYTQVHTPTVPALHCSLHHHHHHHSAVLAFVFLFFFVRRIILLCLWVFNYLAIFRVISKP